MWPIVHDRARILAERVQKRAERASKRVRRDARRERRQPFAFEAFVCASDRTRGRALLLAVDDDRRVAEHARAEVIGADLLAAAGAEDVGGLRCVLVAASEGDQLVTQRAAHLHPAPPRIRLALPHGQPTVREVDVAPAQRA